MLSHSLYTGIKRLRELVTLHTSLKYFSFWYAIPANLKYNRFLSIVKQIAIGYSSVTLFVRLSSTNFIQQLSTGLQLMDVFKAFITQICCSKPLFSRTPCEHHANTKGRFSRFHSVVRFGCKVSKYLINNQIENKKIFCEILKYLTLTDS